MHLNGELAFCGMQPGLQLSCRLFPIGLFKKREFRLKVCVYKARCPEKMSAEDGNR